MGTQKRNSWQGSLAERDALPAANLGLQTLDVFQVTETGQQGVFVWDGSAWNRATGDPQPAFSLASPNFGQSLPNTAAGVVLRMDTVSTETGFITIASDNMTVLRPATYMLQWAIGAEAAAGLSTGDGWAERDQGSGTWVEISFSRLQITGEIGTLSTTLPPIPIELEAGEKVRFLARSLGPDLLDTVASATLLSLTKWRS